MATLMCELDGGGAINISGVRVLKTNDQQGRYVFTVQHPAGLVHAFTCRPNGTWQIAHPDGQDDEGWYL